jgi:hypothetical protein
MRERLHGSRWTKPDACGIEQLALAEGAVCEPNSESIRYGHLLPATKQEQHPAATGSRGIADLSNEGDEALQHLRLARGGFQVAS